MLSVVLLCIVFATFDVVSQLGSPRRVTVLHAGLRSLKLIKWDLGAVLCVMLAVIMQLCSEYLEARPRLGGILGLGIVV